MKTVVVYVDGLFSVCEALGVEKRLLRHPGVRRAEANYLSGTATVEYDESRVTLADIQRTIGQCGYGCAGECLPHHLREPGHAATRGGRR